MSDKHLQQIAEIARQLVQLQAEAQAYGDAWVSQAETEATQRKAAADRACLQATEQAQAAYEKATAQAQRVHDQAVSEANRKREAALAAARTAYTVVAGLRRWLWRREAALAAARAAYAPQAARAQAASAAIREDAGLLEADWGAGYWLNWRPGHITPAAGLPLAQIGVRIGTLTEQGAWDTVSFPALAPLMGGLSLLLKSNPTARSTAIHATQSLLLRLLAAIPPGKLRFTFIDPVGLGQNAAPFMHLADYDEQLVTSRAWTEPQHIEQQLANLTEQMENVIQKYLRNEYADIEAYNAQAGEVAEPYRLLAVFDFPTNFSESAARRLVSIVQNGPRCGVYAVVLVDMDKPLPYGFNLADLEQHATVIAWNGERFVWQDEDFKDCLLELDEPPPPELFNRIVQTVGEAAKAAGKVEVPFARIAPPAGDLWTQNANDGLSAALGPAGARAFQHFMLGQGTAQHALVVGRTGAGKSNLLHVLITNLALTYGPDEVDLYLIDFKKGVEFKPYAVRQLPHARVIAIESEREFGLSVLQGLDAELKRRGDLFRAALVDSLSDFRNKTGQPLPRILLLVDEFQEFFTEEDAVATQSAQILDRLVRQGRSFGIHILLGSQTLAGAYTLARSTIDQMAVRIALQCSEADSRLILADDNLAARLLSRPGEAIYNAANGRIEGNNLFQAALLTDEERERYLTQLQDLARQQGYQPAQPQIVFEGNAPADVQKNQPLHELLAAPAWPASSRRAAAWLGEPIAIRPPTAAHFRRQSGSNLLIVGQNAEQALGMMLTALLSLAAHHAPANGRFYLLDFTPADAPYAGVLRQLAGELPHETHWGSRRQLPDLVAGLAAEVERRLDADESESARQPALYFFIYGLHRARDLRLDENVGFGDFSFGDEQPAAPSPAQQFPTILREGPEVGIHTLVWCDTVTNLNRVLDRRALREFELRVAFQMSAEDSTLLIDTPLASQLGPYRTLLVSEEEGRSEKFRPYDLPPEAWTSWAAEQLRGRSTGCG